MDRQERVGAASQDRKRLLLNRPRTIHAPRITILDRGSRDRRSIMDRPVWIRLMTRTGSGPSELTSSFSEIEQSMVAVMGGEEFATGDQHLSVNPFPAREVNTQIFYICLFIVI